MAVRVLPFQDARGGGLAVGRLDVPDPYPGELAVVVDVAVLADGPPQRRTGAGLVGSTGGGDGLLVVAHEKVLDVPRGEWIARCCAGGGGFGLGRGGGGRARLLGRLGGRPARRRGGRGSR